MAGAEGLFEHFHRPRQQGLGVGRPSHVLIKRGQVEKRRSGFGVLGADEFFPQAAGAGKVLFRLF